MDLCRIKGKDYLIIVDYLTDFFELPDLPASSLVKAVKQPFARHGIPVWVVVHSLLLESSQFSPKPGVLNTLCHLPIQMARWNLR